MATPKTKKKTSQQIITEFLEGKQRSSPVANPFSELVQNSQLPPSGQGFTPPASGGAGRKSQAELIDEFERGRAPIPGSVADRFNLEPGQRKPQGLKEALGNSTRGAFTPFQISGELGAFGISEASSGARGATSQARIPQPPDVFGVGDEPIITKLFREGKLTPRDYLEATSTRHQDRNALQNAILETVGDFTNFFGGAGLARRFGGQVDNLAPVGLGKVSEVPFDALETGFRKVTGLFGGKPSTAARAAGNIPTPGTLSSSPEAGGTATRAGDGTATADVPTPDEATPPQSISGQTPGSTFSSGEPPIGTGDLGEDAAEGLERGFITHVGESPMGSPLLRQMFDEEPVLYSPITNKGTLEKASAAVDADTAASRARVMSDAPLDPETMVDTMAEGIVLMRKAATADDIVELKALSQRIAERLTPSAQAVQLASTIDKLSPEGLFTYIARILKKAETQGKGPRVAPRLQSAGRKAAVEKATKDAVDEVTRAEEAVVKAKEASDSLTPPTTRRPTTRKPADGIRKPSRNQRAKDLEYLIDDSVREVQATLTTAERQAIIKAKSILKQSVAEMDESTANFFLDRAAALNDLEGEARVQAILELVEEVRGLSQVESGVATGRTLKPSPKLLKQQAADLTQMIDRTSRNVFQQLNSVDRLAIARVKNLLKRTDVELPQGMAEELLEEARALRGLPQAEQAAALNNLTAKLKAYDPIANELARTRAIADAEARVRQQARQTANDLDALIDAGLRKTTTKVTTADRAAIGQAKAILRQYGAELPEDMARDFLAKARALNDLPEAQQAAALRVLVDEVKQFNPVKIAMEEAAATREAVKLARQRAKDYEYLTQANLRESKTRLKNVTRDAIRTAKSRLKAEGIEMSDELAESFLDRARALQDITDEYDQMRAAQSLMADVQALLPPSKWDTALSVIGLNRVFQASMDISFMGRQGWPYVFSHPQLWWDTLGTSIKSFMSEDVAIAADRQFFSRPLHNPMKEAGLDYIDRAGPLSQREESMMSSWSDKMPGIRQSNRSFITASNKLRSEAADSYVLAAMRPEVREAVLSGERRLETLDDLVEALDGAMTRDDIGKLTKWHNALSGRGNVGEFLKANNKWLNALFYSFRFGVSRFEVPVRAGRDIITNPALRKSISRDLGAFLAGTTTVLLLADQSPGVSVEWDPRSSDFRKIRVGNQRFSIDAGFDVFARYLAQFATGQQKDTGTGQITDKSRTDTFPVGYLMSKLSPSAGEVKAQLDGRDYVGNPVQTWDQRLKSIAADFVPFIGQDMYEAWKSNGGVGVGIAAPTGALGFSSSSYASGSPEWQEDLKDYYDIPTSATDRKEQGVRNTRDNYRQRNPEIDAKLFLTGGVTSLKSGAAVGAAQKLMEESGISPNTIDAIVERIEKRKEADRVGLRLETTFVDRLIKRLDIESSEPAPTSPSGGKSREDIMRDFLAGEGTVSPVNDTPPISSDTESTLQEILREFREGAVR